VTGAREARLRLLAWMRSQDFELVRGELLSELEQLVVEEHAGLHRDLLGEPWSPPHAYRWIRYESPDPIGQLMAATDRLATEWAQAGSHPGCGEARRRFSELEGPRLARALALAAELGYKADPR
jgi:hypothetical protein